MICADIRQKLLNRERPDRPGPEESRHLATCLECQTWLRRLVRLERRIIDLKVPASPVPGALLEQILAPQGKGPLISSPVHPTSDVRRVREGGRQKLALALSLAATLSLFTLAWWAWPPHEPDNKPAPTLSSSYARLIEHRTHGTATPQERVQALSALAEEFLQDLRTLGSHPEHAQLLARHFERLMQHDLLDEARAVPVANRAAVLSPIAERLRQAESEASRLAAEWAAQHAESARALRQVAASAHEADLRLRALVPSSRT